MGDFKEYRKRELRDFVLVNIIMILYFSGMMKPFFELLEAKDISCGFLFIARDCFEDAFIVGVVYIFVFIFDSLVTGDAKTKVALYGIKGLPGETIFTSLRDKKIKDNRFTISELISEYTDIYKTIDSDVYSDANEKKRYENSHWYKIYVKYASSEQKLWIAQKDFLLCRDMTMACMYLMLLYLIGCAIFPNMEFSTKTLIMLAFEALLCDIATRSKARKFVVDVIATDLAKAVSDQTRKMT